MASRILNENYLDPDTLANDYVSSEQTAFPVINVYNVQRRSKVWRSNGYWEITASNNEFTFKETGLGADLTATVAVAEYATTTAMLAALKTAMETVSVDTFTCSVDATTGKIQIASSGTDFEIVAGGTMMSILGFTTLPKTGAVTYLADELRIHTSEWVKWDFGISTNPDVFCLIGKRNSPIGITPGAVIKLQGNSTDVWTAPEYDETLTYDDSIINVFKTSTADGLHTDPLRYWRIYFEDKSNPNGFIEVGAMFLGKYYEPTRGAIQFPFSGNYIDRSETSFSEGGQSFSDKRDKSESFSVSWGALQTSEKEQMDLIFDQFGLSDPFFVAFDPNLAFSSSTGYYVRYVKFDGAPRYSLDRPNFWSLSMDLREEL